MQVRWPNSTKETEHFGQLAKVKESCFSFVVIFFSLFGALKCRLIWQHGLSLKAKVRQLLYVHEKIIFILCNDQNLRHTTARV